MAHQQISVSVKPGFLGTQHASGCIHLGKAQPGSYYPRRNGNQVSRLVLEAKLGRSIKPGYYACHKCDNCSCISPKHLFEGSPRENLLDAMKKGRRKSGWQLVAEQRRKCLGTYQTVYESGTFSK